MLADSKVGGEKKKKKEQGLGRGEAELFGGILRKFSQKFQQPGRRVWGGRTDDQKCKQCGQLRPGTPCRACNPVLSSLAAKRLCAR